MSTPHNTSNLVPTSIEAYNQYGIQPTKLRFIVQNIFYFPQDYRDTLTKYFLLVEDTEVFLSSITEGMLEHEGLDYQVIYHNTDPTRLLRRAEYTEVKLSFRIADNLFDITPTVLVKEIRT